MSATRRRVTWCAAVALCAASCGHHGRVAESAPGSPEIMAVVESFHSAFEAEDVERMGRLLSADSSFIFFGTGAEEIQTSRQAFLDKHETADWAQLDEIVFGTPEHVRIQASPQLAVVMYQTILRFEAGGKEGALPLRLALTLVPEDGDWRITQGLAAQIVQ